jgi:hypothetical protein
MATRWRIIERTSDERQKQLQDELVFDRDARQAVERSVRRLVDSDPELRERIRRVAKNSSARRVAKSKASPIDHGRELGGGVAAVIVERADGTTRRINLNADDPREVTKNERASYRDLFAEPVWDGTTYVEKG